MDAAAKLSPEKLAALLQELEVEKQRRIDERVARGEALCLPPIAVGASDSVEPAKADAVTQLRAGGEKREIVFSHATFGEDGRETRISAIITGVPRTGRDKLPDDYEPWKPDPSKPPYVSPPSRDLMRREAPDPFDLPPESEPKKFWVTVEPPIEGKSHGCIVEGSFTTTPDGTLRVRDREGRVYLAKVAPGDDVEYAARKLLREKKGQNAFHGPIKYPSSSFH